MFRNMKACLNHVGSVLPHLHLWKRLSMSYARLPDAHISSLLHQRHSGAESHVFQQSDESLGEGGIGTKSVNSEFANMLASVEPAYVELCVRAGAVARQRRGKKQEPSDQDT